MAQWSGVTVTVDRVTSLNLSDSHLGLGLTGAIPPELGNLTSLERLHLSRNQLSGAIPPELGNLANLTDLRLHNNPLSGYLPLSFTNLTKLRLLAISGTNLCLPSDPAFQAWLQGINVSGGENCIPTATEDTDKIPTDFSLEPNYPNPFHSQTTISYTLPQPAAVRLVVYDLQGRLVKVLVETEQTAGR